VAAELVAATLVIAYLRWIRATDGEEFGDVRGLVTDLPGGGERACHVPSCLDCG
jgi:hypothetical protein